MSARQSAAPRFFRRLLRLRIEILLGFRRRELVRAPIDDRRMFEVSVRRRRRRRPFERVRLPRVATGLGAEEQAVKEVDQEDNLNRAQYERTNTDELVERLQVLQEPILQRIGNAAH